MGARCWCSVGCLLSGLIIQFILSSIIYLKLCLQYADTTNCERRVMHETKI